VVVDAHNCTIVRLVVEPKGRKGEGRLVPIDLVGAGAPGAIRLRCTLAQFDALDRARTVEEQTASTVDVESRWAEVQAMARPAGPRVELGMGMHQERREVAEESVQAGEGEIWRGQRVHASDGPVGHVLGLLTDADRHQVTYVLLDEGHLWGRKTVGIPVRAVRFVLDDGVTLNLTRKEVGDLPPAEVGPAT
jgi:hypothetical protein